MQTPKLIDRRTALSLALGLCGLFATQSAMAQDADTKVYVRVLAIKASGKLGKEAEFGKGCKHLAGAFKKLTFGKYEVLKSFKKECKLSEVLNFEMGFDRELKLTPAKGAKRFVTAVSLSKVKKDKDGKKTLKNMLSMKAKSKDGSSVVLGSQKMADGDFHLLIVFTVQSKPFK
ncbi:MAG: hypothetical protein P1V97_28210 [Planctomycetota bacterium]|nr:hypothetical protein [Planctomycetota bacterium]